LQFDCLYLTLSARLPNQHTNKTGGTSEIWDEVEEDDNVDGEYYDEDGYAFHFFSTLV